jgi:hypothetical protein
LFQLRPPPTSDANDRLFLDATLERRISSPQTGSLSNGPFPDKDIDEDDDDVVVLDEDMMASVDTTVAPNLYNSWADINHEVSLMALRTNKQAFHPLLPLLIRNNAKYFCFVNIHISFTFHVHVAFVSACIFTWSYNFMHNFTLNFRFNLQKTSWPPKVSCVGDLSGHKRRVYRCLHWLAAYKAHQNKVKYIVPTSTLVHFLSYTLRPYPLLLKSRSKLLHFSNFLIMFGNVKK